MHHFHTSKFPIRVWILFLLVFVNSPQLTQCQVNCYNGVCGPENWPGLCNNGTLQSPIDIIISKLVKSRPGIGKKKTKILKFSKSFYKFQQFDLYNTGHTLVVYLADGGEPMVAGGAGWPPGTYSFSLMSLSWGSQHTIDGKRFALEINMRFQQTTGQLGVLSILFANSTKSKPLQLIVDMIPQLIDPLQQIGPVYLNLSAFLPNVWDVFRYNGSAMAPPCTEGFLRSVFTQRMPVSNAQVAAFRKLKDLTGKPMKNNYRPTQKVVTANRKNIIWMQVDKNQMMDMAF